MLCINSKKVLNVIFIIQKNCGNQNRNLYIFPGFLIFTIEFFFFSYFIIIVSSIRSMSLLLLHIAFIFFILESKIIFNVKKDVMFKLTVIKKRT